MTHNKKVQRTEIVPGIISYVFSDSFPAHDRILNKKSSNHYTLRHTRGQEKETGINGRVLLMLQILLYKFSSYLSTKSAIMLT